TTSRRHLTHTCAGSSTTTSNRRAAVRMAWRTTATRSGRTGMRGWSRTSICSTTRICGAIGRVRCGGGGPRRAGGRVLGRGRAFGGAAGFDSMRSRGEVTVPENEAGIWRSPGDFFRMGGTRDWASLLDDRDIAHFTERLCDLAGEASEWAVRGRVALEEETG